MPLIVHLDDPLPMAASSPSRTFCRLLLDGVEFVKPEVSTPTREAPELVAVLLSPTEPTVYVCPAAIVTPPFALTLKLLKLMVVSVPFMAPPVGKFIVVTESTVGSSANESLFAALRVMFKSKPDMKSRVSPSSILS